MTEEGTPEPGFEEAIDRLEQVVAALESGRLGLDEALARYEDGVGLLRRCRSILESAERKVALLTEVDDEGNPQLSPFEAPPTAGN